MQHFVSLQSQNDMPFARAFTDPSLEIKVTFRPQTYNYTSPNNGAWAYVCPLLQDTTTNNVLEYCLQEWQPTTNDPKVWPFKDKVAACNEVNGKPFDTPITTFGSGTIFATKEGGSSNTVIGGLNSIYNFAATISTGNLINAINATNSKCAPRSYSTNPADYRLLGIESGTEMWRDAWYVGNSHTALTVNTIY